MATGSTGFQRRSAMERPVRWQRKTLTSVESEDAFAEVLQEINPAILRGTW